MDVRKRLGSNLRDERLRLRFSQEQLAELSGLNRTYVGSVERGERNLSLVNICRLARALGIAPKDLLRGIQLEEDDHGRSG